MVGPQQVVAGSKDVSVVIFIADSGDGTPETAVTSATGGLDLRYRRDGAATAALTESDLSALTDAHSDGGMLHIFGGYYRVDIPDAAFAAGVDKVQIVGTATGMVVHGPTIELTDPVNLLFKSEVIDASGHTSSNLRVSAFDSYGSDELNGELLWYYDVSADEWHLLECTDFDTTNNDLTVRMAAGGGNLPFTPEASVDRIARAGINLQAIQTDRLPAALVNGRMDSSVDGTGMEAGAIAVIADGVLDEVMAGHTTTGTLGAAIGDGDAGAGMTVLVAQRAVPAKNGAFTFVFKLVDSTDHVTPETGLSPSGEVSKDGAAFGAIAGTITEIGNGWYQCAAVAADMNANRCLFRFTGTGADDAEAFIVTDGGV